jgi:hypothetical protein
MKHHHSFADLRDAIFAPKPAKRARGGRTEMRVSGNPDVYKEADGDASYATGDLKAPGTRGKRRAARARSRTKTLGAMSGARPKHRADKRARGGRKRFADGGGAAPYGGASSPLAGFPSFIPNVQITPGHGAPPPPAPIQDNNFAQQLGLAALSGLGRDSSKNDDDSKADGQGIIGSIRLPGGGTLGDATSDALQDFRMDTLGRAEARGGRVKSKRKG